MSGSSRKIPRDLHSNKLNEFIQPYEFGSSAADIPKHLAGLDCWIMGNAEPHHGAVVVRWNRLKVWVTRGRFSEFNLEFASAVKRLGTSVLDDQSARLS